MVTLRGVSYNGHPVPSFSAIKKRKRKKKNKRRESGILSLYMSLLKISRDVSYPLQDSRLKSDYYA